MNSRYDTIGVGYDVTRRADPYIAGRLAHHLAIGAESTYLDVACGSGNYTVALAGLGGRWHGADQSREMIRSAKPKSGGISWCQADAAALPFRDGVFDGAICTLAIHHFDALVPVFREIYRIAGEGRLVIFKATPEQMKGYWLNEYFPVAMAKSMEQMPEPELVQDSLTAAGFRVTFTEAYEVLPDLQDFFLYSGKHHPEMYLSETVRKGISTFASLAEPVEVISGCARLRADIESGRIDQVMKSYRRQQGDYLFMVCEKDL